MAEAVAARDDLRETDKRETRILIQTHPDVLIVPPDPPQLLIKLGQVRQAIHVAYYRPPVEAKRAVHHLHLVGVHERGGQQPAQTPRGAARAHLADPAHRESAGAAADHPLPRRGSPAGRAAGRGLEALLAQRRPELKPRDRALAARLAEGAVGRALTIDLDAYLASRQDALIILRTALRSPTTRSSSTRPKATAPAPTGRRRPSTCCARWAACLKTCC